MGVRSVACCDVSRGLCSLLRSDSFKQNVCTLSFPSPGLFEFDPSRASRHPEVRHWLLAKFEGISGDFECKPRTLLTKSTFSTTLHKFRLKHF